MRRPVGVKSILVGLHWLFEAEGEFFNTHAWLQQISTLRLHCPRTVDELSTLGAMSVGVVPRSAEGAIFEPSRAAGWTRCVLGRVDPSAIGKRHDPTIARD